MLFFYRLYYTKWKVIYIDFLKGVKMLQDNKIRNILRQAERNLTELPKTEQLSTTTENANHNIMRVAVTGQVYDDRKKNNR